jgi:hypothetical protein
MNQTPFFFGNEDLLKLLIKECIREVLTELYGKVPYPPVQNTLNESKLRTRNQAAAYLQVTPNTLTRYVSQGKLLPAIINGKYRFFESDLLKFLESRKA